MFEISDLKAKKLPELQEIAKELSVPKFKSMKKLDLVYQILDVQASNPKAVVSSAPAAPKAPKAPKVQKERQAAPAPEKKTGHAPKAESNPQQK